MKKRYKEDEEMNNIKYFVIQFVLFGVVIFTNYYLSRYISKPFTLTDLIAIIISISVMISALILYFRFKKNIHPIRLFNKTLISLLAIFFAIIFIGVLIGEVQIDLHTILLH
ncbi:hypothetical protein [Oceanobacillus sp. CAU 1775]